MIAQEYLQDVRISEPFIYNNEIIGYPFNLNDLINKWGKDIIPDKMGIYKLFYNNHLVYIGMSRKLRGRLLCHLKDNDKPFNGCLWFVTDDKTIEQTLLIEKNMINKFKPSLNLTYANL